MTEYFIFKHSYHRVYSFPLRIRKRSENVQSDNLHTTRINLNAFLQKFVAQVNKI